MTTLFITGIDTDIGKSVACGALAKALITSGYHVFTQKLVETGCNNSKSADLITHQNIVGKAFNTATPDQHCPYTFPYPASPHLAAQREGKTIDCDYLIKQIHALQEHSEHLLIEGAGGLCVPLNQDTQIIDFIAENNLPIVLVTSAKLGSINHTLLSLTACQQHGINIKAVIYNQYGQDEEAIINDTRNVLKQYVENYKHDLLFLELEKDKHDIPMTEEQLEQLLAPST